MTTPRGYRGGLKATRDFIKQLKVSAACEACGIDDPAVLDFHHDNPQDKEFSISAAPKLKKTRTEVMRELEKTRVLCANCHRILHALAVEKTS